MSNWISNPDTELNLLEQGHRVMINLVGARIYRPAGCISLGNSPSEEISLRVLRLWRAIDDGWEEHDNYTHSA